MYVALYEHVLLFTIFTSTRSVLPSYTCTWPIKHHQHVKGHVTTARGQWKSRFKVSTTTTHWQWLVYMWMESWEWIMDQTFGWPLT